MAPLVIGGVFDLPDLGEADHDRLGRFMSRAPGAWHLSGRSALSEVFAHARSIGVAHLHLPAYLCSSVMEAVHGSGIDYSFYMVRGDLSIDVDPRHNSAILLIHYFGWQHPSAAALRAAIDTDVMLIEDASQSSLSSWVQDIDRRSVVVTNPRKFGPVPVGAWCSIAKRPPNPDAIVLQQVEEALHAAWVKHAYLQERGATRDLDREAGFVHAFRELESALGSQPTPLALPPQFLNLLAQVDWDRAADTRRANWEALRRQLPPTVNPVTPELGSDTVPLGLPVRVARRDAVRASLAQAGVLCPVHWDLPAEVDPRRFPGAVDLSGEILTLPIDQRYELQDMQTLADSLTKAIA